MRKDKVSLPISGTFHGKSPPYDHERRQPRRTRLLGRLTLWRTGSRAGLIGTRLAKPAKMLDAPAPMCVSLGGCLRQVDEFTDSADGAYGNVAWRLCQLRLLMSA